MLVLVLEILMAITVAIVGLAILPGADGACLLAAGLLLGFGAVLHYSRTGTINPWVTRGAAAVLVIVALCMPSAPQEETSDVRMMTETAPPVTTSTTIVTTTTTTAATTTVATTATMTATTKATTTATTAAVIAWTEPATTATAAVRSAPEETTTVTSTAGTKVSLVDTSIVIPEAKYVLNTNSKIIHNPWCQSVQAISQKNYQETNATVEELEAMGFRKCQMHGDWNP